jgi:hypothetical protein
VSCRERKSGIIGPAGSSPFVNAFSSASATQSQRFTLVLFISFF